MRKIFGLMFLSLVFTSGAFAQEVAANNQSIPVDEAKTGEYIIGTDDVLDVNVLQPDKFTVAAIVTPDGAVSIPYIGSVVVKGMSLTKAQEFIQSRLADGYMKYPVVVVSLKESRSKKFFVYGEVAKPGTYFLDAHTTVLQAITTAGGFTKFGSTSSVKVLRPRGDKPGYDPIKVNIKALMDGDSKEDMLLLPGDILVINETAF